MDKARSAQNFKSNCGMSVYFWIALGGALGSVARFAGSELAFRWWGGEFPWGTVIVNISGCFALGLFAALTGPEGRWPVSTELRQFFIIGVCGGYTTFSSFSWQTLTMLQNGAWIKAAANVVLSVTLCMLAVWIGHSLGSAPSISR